MIIHHADRPVVKWAIDHGYPYEYLREYGLPEPSLRVQLGLSSAFFEAGRLVHWRAEADARYLDQLMAELVSLYSLCARTRAYPPQMIFISPEERAALQRPSAESA